MSTLPSISKVSQIATFGEIVFGTSFKKTMTFNNMSIKQSVNYAEHNVINEKPKLEYTGLNLVDITMDVKLSSFFKVDPLKELQLFQEYCEEGIVETLILGSNVFGEFVITDIDQVVNRMLLGNVQEIDLKVTFKEYN